MAGQIRKPFQGLFNIIRFNWHFYAFALLFSLTIAALLFYWPSGLDWALYLVLIGTILSTLLSLLASYYIYDVSNLYTLNWLDGIEIPKNANLLNINAGFDETSYLLHQKYPTANLQALDFYNPLKHTEISIERARKAYPPYPRTQTIETTNIGISANTIDCIFLILAAHEIRDIKEQIAFFKALKSTLKQQSNIVVVEHSRDLYNFMVYNFGFFHFFGQKRWWHVFNSAGLNLNQQSKITPFITVYFLN